MNKLSIDKIRRHLIVGCVLAIVAGAAPATMGGESSSSIYIVGEYGYLEKRDGNLEVIATGNVPKLAKAVNVRDVDISPDGTQLFLAVSRIKNPLVVVHTADLRVDESVIVEFPHPNAPWKAYHPFSIIAASPNFLYMTDESYSTAPNPFSTVLVDLTAKTATPQSGYSFMSKMQIQVSAKRERMALYDGSLYFIDIPTGKVVDSIPRELVGKDKWVMWFDIDWDKYIAELYLIPIEQGEKTIEKICIDVKSKSKVCGESLQSKTMFGFYKAESYRKITTTASSKIYIQDRHGNIEIVNRRGVPSLERLDNARFKKGSSRSVASYVSPDERLLFYQKDNVKASSNGRHAQDLSSLCVMDMTTRKIIKTIEFPQRIVGVLFSK